ncbi:hypothetical protein F5146DRAFT_1123695 [Armillaria mellea]|nr:hypothetical protein F5146DRAFT_1123695 [Armillaria mellea]
MFDGGVSLVPIVGLGAAIISKTCVLFMPEKRIDRLDVALNEADILYQEVKEVLPADVDLDIRDNHDTLINQLYMLDRTRWGHLKSFSSYVSLKRRINSHCADVKANSRIYASAAALAASKKRAAKEAEEKARFLEEEAAQHRLKQLKQDFCVLRHRLQQICAGNRSAQATANLSSLADRLLNSSQTSLPLPHPVMTPLPYPSHASHVEGLHNEPEDLHENLINFSNTFPDTGLQEGILADLSTDDAESLHNFFSAESDISYLEGISLLTTLLNSPNVFNVATTVSHPTESSVSRNASTSANPSGNAAPTLVQGPETATQGHFTLDHLINSLRAVADCVSASTDIYEAVVDA